MKEKMSEKFIMRAHPEATTETLKDHSPPERIEMGTYLCEDGRKKREGGNKNGRDFQLRHSFFLAFSCLLKTVLVGCTSFPRNSLFAPPLLSIATSPPPSLFTYGPSAGGNLLRLSLLIICSSFLFFFFAFRSFFQVLTLFPSHCFPLCLIHS